MREIKFRAWDRDHGEMVYQSPTVDAAKILSRYDVVMQYTGLHDKYGKEIYEGDIVKLTCSDGIETITDISWLRGRYVINTMMMFSDTLITHKCEVVGNIHEHPHLLEVVTK